MKIRCCRGAVSSRAPGCWPPALRRRRFCKHPLGLCRLSGPPGQVVVANTPGRTVRYRRPHRRGRASAIDRQDLHHREHRWRRRQYRLWQRRAFNTRRLHAAARDQCLVRSIRASTPRFPYDPHKDFVGVCELASSPNTFVVNADLPAKTMKEFVALARANPDKFNCATPPIGTSPQIQLEVLKIREKLPKLADVVFKGGGDAITALLGGSVQLSSGSLGPAAPHIKAGKLRCLAVSAESRWPDLPDVPTMQEQGYKDFVFPTDMVLLAPAKTPPDIVAWTGERNAESAQHAGNEGEIVQVRASRCVRRAPRRPGRASSRKSPFSRTSSTRPESEETSRREARGDRRAIIDRADRRQPADAQARHHGGRGGAPRRQRAWCASKPTMAPSAGAKRPRRR